MVNSLSSNNIYKKGLKNANYGLNTTIKQILADLLLESIKNEDGMEGKSIEKREFNLRASQRLKIPKFLVKQFLSELRQQEIIEFPANRFILVIDIEKLKGVTQ